MGWLSTRMRCRADGCRHFLCRLPCSFWLLWTRNCCSILRWLYSLHDDKRGMFSSAGRYTDRRIRVMMQFFSPCDACGDVASMDTNTLVSHRSCVCIISGLCFPVPTLRARREQRKSTNAAVIDCTAGLGGGSSQLDRCASQRRAYQPRQGITTLPSLSRL